MMADYVPGSIQTTATLQVGSSVTGTIDEAGDEDWYRVTLQAGTTYIVAMKGVASGGGNLVDPTVRLRTGTGQDFAFSLDIGSRTADARCIVIPPTSGEYLVKAGGFIGTGTFTLALSVDDHADSATGASTLTLGKAETGRIDYVFESVISSIDGFPVNRTDQDWFRIELQASQTYRFTVRGSQSGGGTLTDPSLSIRDAFGREVASKVTFGGASDATIEFQASSTGSYYVVATAPLSVFTDTGGKTYTVTAETVADVTAPRVVTFSPADGALGVPVGSNIVLTFSEAIRRGKGEIVLKTADGTVVETFDVSNSARLALSGNTLTIDPSANLATEARFLVVLPSAAIEDLSGNAYGGTSSYDFTSLDPTPPVAVGFSPADGAGGVDVRTPIVVTFSENIQRGTGNIVLKTAAGALVESFNVASSFQLSVSGTTLTIDPTKDLTPGEHYQLALPAGSIKDAAGNAHAGTTGYDFTVAPFGIRSLSPADGEGWVTPATDIVIEFNATVQRGSGTIHLRTAAGAIVESFDAATSSRLSISGGKVNINPSADLAPGTQYLLELPGRSFLDLSSQGFAGTTSYDFSTVAMAGNRITGTASRDTLTGTTQDDYIDGGGGSDDLDGGDGNDTLDSGSGFEVVFTESRGDDTMIVREGNRYYTLHLGGPNGGNDTLVLSKTFTLSNLTIGTVGDEGFVELKYAEDTRADATLTLTAWLENVVFVGQANANAVGNETANRMTGNAGNNRLSGLAGNDWFSGAGGDDRLDGGEGLDRARFEGLMSDYRITIGSGSTTVTDSAGGDGTDTLIGIERISFADKGVAYDLDGHAGSVAKILGALFGKAYLANREFVGIGLGLLDAGTSYADLVALALGTEVFAQLAGSRSNTDFVNLVYRNVVGSLPGPADLGYFVNLLDSGTDTQVSLALLACETELNKVHIDLVGLPLTGIEFAPGG